VNGSAVVGTLDFALELLGTFMFALSGAAAAVKIKLDLFGVLVLAYCASSAGGILRDLLIGAVPPAAVTDWRFLAATLLAGFFTMLYPPIFRLRSAVPMLDALGLGFFAVDGARKALEYGLGPVAASLMGMLTGSEAQRHIPDRSLRRMLSRGYKMADAPEAARPAGRMLRSTSRRPESA